MKASGGTVRIQSTPRSGILSRGCGFFVGVRKDLGGAGRPLERGSPYPPNLPDPPRTSLHGNRRREGKDFFRFRAAVAAQGSFGVSGGAWRQKVRLSRLIREWGRVGRVPFISADLSPPSSVAYATASPQGEAFAKSPSFFTTGRASGIPEACLLL